MPLDPPNLDTRTFRELVADARARIPRFTPDWTNLNDSDPGMTLVKLNAWLTETVLFQLNRVPDLTYTKFLELLNVRARPAQAARTELTFALKKLDKPTDGLRVLIPEGTKVAVDDPDLDQEVLFETDRRLEAVNAAIGAVIAPLPPDAGDVLELVTEYDPASTDVVWTHPARLGLDLSEAPGVPQRPAYVGLLLRPNISGELDRFSQDTFPDGPLDLFVEVTEPGPDSPGGAATQTCLFPWEVEARADTLSWQVYVGSEPEVDFAPEGGAGAWAPLKVSDSTAGLTRRGHVTLEVPRRLTRVGLSELPRSIWQDMGLKKPPRTEAEFFADLADPDLDLYGALTADDGSGEAILERMGLADAGEREDLLSCCVSGTEAAEHLRRILDANDPPVTLDPGAVRAEDWVALEAGYDAAATPVHDGADRPLYWLRIDQGDRRSETAEITRLSLNTVPATQGETRLDERLGASDGRPDQSFALSKTPLLIPDPETGPPDAEIEVGGEIWEPRFDFFGSGPESPVYTLDPETGEIRFGDGRHGQIPVAGAAVRAVRYRWGGGAIGNAGAGAITKIKGALRDVDGVENRVPAENGDDAELREDTLLRAPHDLRTRDRAVSAEDFAHLAAQTPGVPVHRAFALARRKPGDEGYVERDGAVTVVVLPRSDAARPVPSPAQMRAICAHLDGRRLITTELYIAPPQYTEIAGLSARLRAAQSAELTGLEAEARARIAAYFHPLTGGEDGQGWPFGAPISDGAIYRLLLGIQGVERVEDMTVSLGGTRPADVPEDVTPLPEGHLPYLPSEAIDVRATHG